MGKWESLETKSGLLAYIDKRGNWGRWGPADQVGAVNLITPAKRVEAARVVRQGVSVSLARPIATEPGPGNPRPAAHYFTSRPRGSHQGAGSAGDYFGMYFHGRTNTHLDALCHNWDEKGMWNGRSPEQELSFQGFRTCGVENWRDGIVTRGVLFDVPAFRGTNYVPVDRPVMGDELEAIAHRYELDPRPGDALVIYSGRESYSAENGLWGFNRTSESADGPGYAYRPGLHPSCLGPIREWDASLLAWDMMDVEPDPLGHPWGAHAALYAFGVPLIDNALLDGLASTCAASAQYEFLLSVNPLNLHGSTGCPVNPIAVL